MKPGAKITSKPTRNGTRSIIRVKSTRTKARVREIKYIKTSQVLTINQASTVKRSLMTKDFHRLSEKTKQQYDTAVEEGRPSLADDVAKCKRTCCLEYESDIPLVDADSDSEDTEMEDADDERFVREESPDQEGAEGQDRMFPSPEVKNIPQCDQVVYTEGLESKVHDATPGSGRRWVKVLELGSGKQTILEISV
jgi:hypothetical protein